MGIRSKITALPKAEQLEHAIQLLEELLRTDSTTERQAFNYQLTPKETQIILLLQARLGKLVTREALHSYIYLGQTNDPPDIRIVDSFIHRIRKILPVTIYTEWGCGYYMLDTLPITGVNTELRHLIAKGKHWSEETIEDLKRMYQRGDAMSTISYELERTERSCVEQLRKRGLWRDRMAVASDT